MVVKIKQGGAYANVAGVYTKKGGIYQPAAGLFVKSASAYASALAAMGPIAGRTFLSTDDGGTSNRYVCAETNHPLFTTLSNGTIEIWWPNWRANAGGGSVLGGVTEVAYPQATATAMLGYYNASNVYTEVTLVDKTLGTASMVAPAGGYFKGTVSGISALRGRRIFPRISIDFPGGMVWRQKIGDLTNGDRFQFGGSPIPLTPRPTQSYDTAWYGPCLILGITSDDSVAIISDSRDSALADVPNDTYGSVGQFGRLFGPRLATVNVSAGGETAADFALASQSPRRRELIAFAKRRAIGLGVNDCIFNPRTALQIRADIATIESQVGGGLSIVKTLDPVTNGNITTPTYPARDPERLAFNTWARTRAACLDMAKTMEVGTTGQWASATYTSDFTHETNVGNAAGVAAAAFDWTTIGNPSVMALT